MQETKKELTRQERCVSGREKGKGRRAQIQEGRKGRGGEKEGMQVKENNKEEREERKKADDECGRQKRRVSSWE